MTLLEEMVDVPLRTVRRTQAETVISAMARRGIGGEYHEEIARRWRASGAGSPVVRSLGSAGPCRWSRAAFWTCCAGWRWTAGSLTSRAGPAAVRRCV